MSFLLSRYFKITSLLDVMLLPVWLRFRFQNPSKSRLGGVLGRLEPSWKRLEASWRRLGASCGRLEPSWRRLEASWSRPGASWGRLGASWKRLKASWSVLDTLQAAPERETMNLQWFWQVLGG